MTTLSPSWYSLSVAPGASVDKPGLFEWRIDGVGSYIGTFKQCDSRLKDFTRNMERLLNGEDYRPDDPDGFRRIHHELAKAIRSETELLPAEAGRLKENVSYGLKSFAHDLLIRKLLPPSSGSTIGFRYLVIHTKWYFRS